ncbi:unnamed protein product, partial [marine sediment metagenome]
NCLILIDFHGFLFFAEKKPGDTDIWETYPKLLEQRALKKHK